MGLHAGFAAALSIKTSAIQRVVHAAYVNNLIPAVIHQSDSGLGVTYDLFLTEPLVIITDTSGSTVTVRIDVLGTLTWAAAGKPTIVNTVEIKGDVTMQVVLVAAVGGIGFQIGLDTSTTAVTNATSTRISGDNPKPFYGVDPEDDSVAFFALVAAATADPAAFLLTPPQLPEFSLLGYTLALSVSNTHDSLNAGIDVVGMTTGNLAALVDMNRLSTSKGYKKTLASKHVYDDEYGEPIYDIVWSATTKRQSGSHATELAVALKDTVVADVFLHLGRFEAIATFESSKHDGVLGELNSLAGNKAKSTYEPGDEALTFIEQVNIQLKDDVLRIEGVASNFTTLAVHVNFQLEVRFVHTTVVPPATPTFDGMTIEVVSINIDEPDWLTALEAIVGVLGVLLAPATYGVSLIIGIVIDLLISVFKGQLIGNAETKVSGNVLGAASDINGKITFSLPGTTGPTFQLVPDDLVPRSDGLTGWFRLIDDTPAAGIHVSGFGSGNVSWPATTLAAIFVLLTGDEFLFNHADPNVRIRWRVFGDGSFFTVINNDMLLSAPDARTLKIDHASPAFQAFKKLRVQCRVYRPFPSTVVELYAGALDIKIEDRLDRSHPYVHWQHTVYYQGYTAFGQPLGWQIKDRKSQIHRTNAALRCRFADRFSSDAGPEYLDDLPFPLANADQHRGALCEYCFFGGPDKHVLKT